MEKCSVVSEKARGVDLRYVNTSNMYNVEKSLLDSSNGGFDDVFVMVPVPALFNLAGKICREDDYEIFFAGSPIPRYAGQFEFVSSSL